ncbi:uncharacterized protein TNCV_856081 [Trichonephila clavipes]|nr:uncharacterized protein TNCV_856081 [Trichonephila clavipes]
MEIRKADPQEIKTTKNILYFEARKLIVPHLTQTYAQATKPSIISPTTQTDPNITNIICPPLQYLKPVSSANPMPNTSSSVYTVSTSSSSTQEHLLPSPSAIIPTIQKTEIRCLTTANEFAALSTEIQPLIPLPESVPTTFNSEHLMRLKSHSVLRAADSLVGLVEGEELVEAFVQVQGVLPQNWGGIEPKRTVPCMVLKVKANYMNTSRPLPR